jgi:hypothetical protein
MNSKFLKMYNRVLKSIEEQEENFDPEDPAQRLNFN